MDRKGYERVVSAKEVENGEKHIVNTRYYIGRTRMDALMAFILKDTGSSTSHMELTEFKGEPLFKGFSEDGIGYLYGGYAVPELY